MPNTALYSTLKILGSPLLQGLYHHDVVGLENLPEGPYMSQATTWRSVTPFSFLSPCLAP